MIIDHKNGFFIIRLNIRVRVDRKAAKNHSRFSPGIGPITGLNSIHVVAEVHTGALFWLREYRTSPLSVPKRQHWRPSSISVDAHPYSSDWRVIVQYVDGVKSRDGVI
jgi:hypothetical protein